MKLEATRVPVWAAAIDDQPAALAQKLEALTGAGADLEFILARRAPEDPGQGVVFVSQLKGRKQLKAAEEAGFFRTDALHSIRGVGKDRPGIGTAITRAVAELGVNLRGYSGSVIGSRFVGYVALDDVDETAKVVRTLRKL
jgi:hypothetical protein